MLGYCSVVRWGNDRVDLVFVGAFLEFVDCWSDEVTWVEKTLLVDDEGCGAWS